MEKLEKNNEHDEILDDIRGVIEGESLDKVDMNTFSLTDVFDSKKLHGDEINSDYEDNNEKDNIEKNPEKKEIIGDEVVIGEYLAKIVKAEIRRWLDKNMLDIVNERVDEEIKKLVDK